MMVLGEWSFNTKGWGHENFVSDVQKTSTSSLKHTNKSCTQTIPAPPQR